MKKIIALFTAVLLTCACASCGGNEEKSSDGKKDEIENKIELSIDKDRYDNGVPPNP